MYDRNFLADKISAKLQAETSSLRQNWVQPAGTNTRYFVVDLLLPEDVCEQIYKDFPTSSPLWFQRNSFRERKKTFAKMKDSPSLINEITMAFHEANVVDAVAKITDISGLEADPLLYAGGISMMEQADFLNPHIDNSHDMTRARYRRLNLLYYVTPNWSSQNGGNLELWDDSVQSPTELVSHFNRLIVMETNRRSWHSVNPVKADAQRCCVSNYYFTPQSPEVRDYYHVTSFLGRPDQACRRIIGRIDNRLRQTVATTLGITRGKKLLNE